MQQTQLNYKMWVWAAGLVLALFSAIPASQAALAAGDTILDGGPAGPCDPKSASADYAGGTDVNGHPVASADLESQPVPVPGQMLIPLKAPPGRGPAPNPIYVQAEGKKLDALLNPPPACPAPKPR